MTADNMLSALFLAGLCAWIGLAIRNSEVGKDRGAWIGLGTGVVFAAVPAISPSP